MSTRAQIRVTDTSGKKHTLGLYKDAYPEGVIPFLPNKSIGFEDFRNLMDFEDSFFTMPNYFYEISLPKAQVRVYGSRYIDGECQRGTLLFKGTFTEAKKKYQAAI
ncbi:MAG: hypothetical protein UT30_C0045G0007 [Candidatus Uhrbacteria bacterium GW2011_GWF2_39_13]|uniref:Uncharacterized protein n=1 Tax=Candidatus Uhrbacteria bacterium GW2011_GWF2_39_13 TaxID=1618995 RepID=A0A0G0PXL7_9BACT|nr:MAG: hypothetical protein UT30_C0045G0007 [Candidatus Uhrbacteria bacterium GW2011_GWF2_39_13]